MSVTIFHKAREEDKSKEGKPRDKNDFAVTA